MDQAIHLKMTYSLDPASIVQTGHSDWMLFVFASIVMALAIHFLARGAARAWKDIRMELDNRMWSDTYQAWRCRYSNRDDIGGAA